MFDPSEGAGGVTGRGAAGRLWLLLFLVVLTAASHRGCTSSRPPIHLNPNMDDQPKYLPQAPSGFFYDGAAMQAPVPGTVAREEVVQTSEFYTGRSAWGFFVRSPLKSSPQLRERGASRFRIYCRPCHGSQARGKGPVAERTGVRIPLLRIGPATTMPDGQIFQIISRGRGLMPSYAFALPPEDRWAIVAQLRQWQGVKQ